MDYVRVFKGSKRDDSRLHNVLNLIKTQCLRFYYSDHLLVKGLKLQRNKRLMQCYYTVSAYTV